MGPRASCEKLKTYLLQNDVTMLCFYYSEKLTYLLGIMGNERNMYSFHWFYNHEKQEAPLTLRGQRGRCRNIIGEHQNIGKLPQPKATPTFSSGCDFMTDIGKPKLCTKFEVASFSRCRNIKGKPQISGSSPSPGPHPLFLLVRFHDGPWQTQTVYQI